MAGAMCLVADLAVFAGSLATIFGVVWYQDIKRKIGKPIEEDKKEQQPHREEIQNEQITN
jgi:hypothetical protein